MTIDTDRQRPESTARIAGLLYLCMAVLGIFAMAAGSGIVEPGNPAATAMNIRNAGATLHLVLAANVAASLAFLLTGLALYALLRHVHALAAAAMLALVIVAVAIGYANLITQYAQLALATGTAGISFGADETVSLVALYASLQGFGVAVDEIFWGLWLVPLAYLVLKSGYFPSSVGVLLAIAGFSWMLQSLVYLTGLNLPGATSVLTVGTIGEFVFMAYLIVKGVRIQSDAAPASSLGRRLERGV